MKTKRMLGRASLGALIMGLGLLWGRFTTQGSEAEAAGEPVIGSAVAVDRESADSRLARLLKEASLSPGVSEVAKLTELGTSESVLITHVRSSDRAYRLRPEDMAYLRAQKVPDAVISVMIERGAEVRAQRPPMPQVITPVPVAVAGSASVVQVMPGPQFRTSESTLIVIGSSSLKRGLSYRNYYYSPRNYFSSRPYGGLYASFGSYGRPDWGSWSDRGRGYHACR